MSNVSEVASIKSVCEIALKKHFRLWMQDIGLGALDFIKMPAHACQIQFEILDGV